MTEILEVLHLADEHGVTKVQIGRGGVEADLHDQRLAGLLRSFELRAQFLAADDVDASFGEIAELFVCGHASAYYILYASAPHGPYDRGAPAPGRARWPFTRASFSAALALTLIAWGPALDGWFLLDDYRWVLPSDRSFDVLRSFVSTWGHGVAYRPVMRVSFWADLQAFGWNAWAWHLHNLVLHAVNVTLLWSLIRAATSMPAPAFAVAALFAVSPLGHENIAWISGRTHLLGVTFLLLSANLLLRSVLASDDDAVEAVHLERHRRVRRGHGDLRADDGVPARGADDRRWCFPSIAADRSRRITGGTIASDAADAPDAAADRAAFRRADLCSWRSGL